MKKEYPVSESHRITEVVRIAGLVMVSDIQIKDIKFSVGIHIAKKIPTFLLFAHDMPEDTSDKKFKCPTLLRIHGGKIKMKHFGPGGGFIEEFSDVLYVEQKELKICSKTSFELIAIAAVYAVVHELIKDHNIGLQSKTIPLSEMLPMDPIKKPIATTY